MSKLSQNQLSSNNLNGRKSGFLSSANMLGENQDDKSANKPYLDQTMLNASIIS
jgi:hypothetical protein